MFWCANRMNKMFAIKSALGVYFTENMNMKPLRWFWSIWFNTKSIKPLQLKGCETSQRKPLTINHLQYMLLLLSLHYRPLEAQGGSQSVSIAGLFSSWRPCLFLQAPSTICLINCVWDRPTSQSSHSALFSGYHKLYIKKEKGKTEPS